MKSPTNVMMIRAQRKEATAASEDHDRGDDRERREDREMEVVFRHRNRAHELIRRWRAPVLSEETIDVLAELYRMTPKAGMTFVEWLGTKGIGEFA